MMKMKSLLPILCVLLFCFTLLGGTKTFFSPSLILKNQGFFSDTTDMSTFSEWRYTGLREFTSPPWVIEVKVIGDTLIDGKLCRVLGSWFEGVFQEDSPLPVYYKDNRMSFYEDGQFWPMYDFNLNVGDTMQTFMSKNVHAYFLGGGGSETSHFLRLYHPYNVVIGKIDTVLTSTGTILKRFATQEEIGIGMKNVVEGLGSETGLFGFFTHHTADVGWYDFLCYKNESYIYPDENSCSPTSSSDVDKYNFIVSPNPVSDILQINLGEYIPYQGFLQITDATGKQVLRQKLMSGLHSIDISALPPGLYFWTAEDGGVRLKAGKVVKI